jgi:hypothetical protein
MHEMSANCAGILRVNKARFSLHSRSYTAESVTQWTRKRTSKYRQFMGDTTLTAGMKKGPLIEVPFSAA